MGPEQKKGLKNSIDLTPIFSRKELTQSLVERRKSASDPNRDHDVKI